MSKKARAGAPALDWAFIGRARNILNVLELVEDPKHASPPAAGIEDVVAQHTDAHITQTIARHDFDRGKYDQEIQSALSAKSRH